MLLDRTSFGFKRATKSPQLVNVKSLYALIDRMKAAEAEAKALRTDAVSLAACIEHELIYTRDDLAVAVSKLSPEEHVSNGVAQELDALIEVQPARS